MDDYLSERGWVIVVKDINLEPNPHPKSDVHSPAV